MVLVIVGILPGKEIPVSKRRDARRKQARHLSGSDRRGRPPRNRVELSDDILRGATYPGSEITFHDDQSSLSVRLRGKRGTIYARLNRGTFGRSKKVEVGKWPGVSIPEARLIEEELQASQDDPFERKAWTPAKGKQTIAQIMPTFLQYHADAISSEEWRLRCVRFYTQQLEPSAGQCRAEVFRPATISPLLT